MNCHLCDRETPGNRIAGFLQGNPVCVDCDREIAQPVMTAGHVDELAELFTEGRTYRQSHHFSNRIAFYP
jgi:hypothetical protein